MVKAGNALTLPEAFAHIWLCTIVGGLTDPPRPLPQAVKPLVRRVSLLEEVEAGWALIQG